MDPRIERAQELYWRVYGTGQGPRSGCVNELGEMARLHEGIARDRLDKGDARGWIDWYAAVTVLGDAGRIEDAGRLIAEGRRRAGEFHAMSQDILSELSELETWLRAKPGAADSLSPCQHPAVPTQV